MKSELQIGNFYFHFEQDPANADCFYHKLEEGEFVGFMERNYSGDKDDKPPRQLATSLESELFSRDRPDNGTRFEAKICMDKAGKVWATKHDYANDKEVAEKLSSELMQLAYQTTDHRRAECIECKTEYFWLVR